MEIAVAPSKLQGIHVIDLWFSVVDLKLVCNISGTMIFFFKYDISLARAALLVGEPQIEFLFLQFIPAVSLSKSVIERLSISYKLSFSLGSCRYGADLAKQLTVLLQNVLWSCGSLRISFSRRTPEKV